MRAVVMFAVITATGSVAIAGPDMRSFLDAVRQVESGGNDDAVGDGGRSVGPYQIGRAYWRDSGVPGRYEQVRDRAYAERVMFAYWRRYCPKALKSGDLETLARVHNSGPSWRKRMRATDAYWARVKREMSK